VLAGADGAVHRDRRGGLTLLTSSASPVAAPTEQLSLLTQRMPFEAQNALRGEPSAFDALAKSMARLKTVRGEVAAGNPASDASWNKLGDGVAAVADARAAVERFSGQPGGARTRAEAAVGTRRSGERGRRAKARGHEPLPGALRAHRAAHPAGLNGLASGVSDARPPRSVSPTASSS
jgi:hypothetical protein